MAILPLGDCNKLFCIVHEMQDKHNSAMIVKYFIIIKLFNVPSIIFFGKREYFISTLSFLSFLIIHIDKTYVPSYSIFL